MAEIAPSIIEKAIQQYESMQWNTHNPTQVEYKIGTRYNNHHKQQNIW